MTDEEMAEEYVNNQGKDNILDFGENHIDVSLIKQESFLAGLKAGKPQWHDLRKDPNDLPNGDRVVLNQVGMATRYDPNRGFLGLDGIGVIAWCEIPKFEESE